jgi:hypothetical protein
MKRIFTLLFLILFVTGIFAQNSRGNSHSSNQNLSNKNDGTQSGWTKIDNDASMGATPPATGNENVSYYATSDGIYVTINSGTNKIKLYALTGQLLSNGDLSQGHFFTSTRRGIYFLKINNRTYKVICK